MSEDDYRALLRWAAQFEIKRPSTIVRKLICEHSGEVPYLVGNDANAFREAVRQLRGVGINLNQLVRAINSGQVRLPSNADMDTVRQALSATDALRKELNAILERSQGRVKIVGR